MTQESSQREPERPQHSETVGKFISGITRIFPLVWRESGQDIEAQGSNNKHQHGVDVDLMKKGDLTNLFKVSANKTYIWGERIQEGNERGGCGSWLNVEDGDSQVQPGYGKGEGISSRGCDRDVCDDKVSNTVMNLAEHSVPVSRGCFTSILKI